MKLNIPFLSQNDLTIPSEWVERSCAIVSLKMCMDVYAAKNGLTIPSLPDLLKEALFMKGGSRSPTVGWKHDSLIWLAHNHGVPAYREEFRSDHIDLETGNNTPSEFSKRIFNEGIKRIRYGITQGVPVMVSFLPGFGSKANSHLIVVTGFEDGDKKGFYINDPSPISPKENVFVPEEEVIKYWRKFALFVG
jgi:hypothetical protein